jgi:hypothetical protein
MTDQRLWAAMIACAALLGGCTPAPDPSQYKTYDQLLSAEPVAEPTEQATLTESDSTPVAQESPTVTVETTAASESDAAAETVEVPVSALAPVNVVDGSAVSAVLKVSPTATENVGSPAPTTAVVSAKPLPGGVQLLVSERDFRAEGPKGALRVSYDDLDLLKVLNMEPVPDNATQSFPDWLQALSGKKIRIRGFMFPTFEASGIDRFVLARDNQICCFGRDPKVYDLIAVEMQANKTTDYIPNRPFDVVGTFRIEMFAEGGKPLGLYWIDDAQVVDR